MTFSSLHNQSLLSFREQSNSKQDTLHRKLSWSPARKTGALLCPVNEVDLPRVSTHSFLKLPSELTTPFC